MDKADTTTVNEVRQEEVGEFLGSSRMEEEPLIIKKPNKEAALKAHLRQMSIGEIESIELIAKGEALKVVSEMLEAVFGKAGNRK